MNNLIKSLVLVAVFAAFFVAADSVSAATVQFHLRFQSEVFFEGSIDFPAAGVSQITAINHTTKLEESREVNSRSILALLSTIDISSEAFRISTLEYYPEYGSLYIKCMEVASEPVNACDNWQYVVGGTYSYVGMDNYILAGEENVWIYFGDIRLVTPGQGSYKTGQPFSFTAEQYQYEVHGWAPAVGYTIGIKKDGTVVATSAVDSNGKATFTVSEEGNYVAGIVEDFYFPKTSFFVNLFAPSFGPSGGSTPPPTPIEPVVEKVFDTEAAVQFLQTFQQSNGSLSDAAFLNDWAALAVPGNEKLKTYLSSDPSAGDLLTDFERRAMALMALGINPYSGTSTNYIEKILEGFDDTQYGNKDLVNDDIFALLPLVRAGYSSEDLEVQKTVAFILSMQQPNGSWSDVDMTAAAIQALESVSSLAGVQEALGRAKTYLESRKDETGSFGNAYSTSWALQALKALGENVSTAGLAIFQAQDGGLLENDSLNNRIWATAYAIPAALGKPWADVLQSFEREVELQALEVASERSSTSAEILLSIQKEVERIQLAVEELQPQVAFLYNQHLAKVEQERTIASINQEIAQVRNEIASLQVSEAKLQANEEVELQVEELAEERSSTSAQSQTASVAEALPPSNGLGARQVALLVVAGFAIFLLAGGTNLVSPLLRKMPAPFVKKVGGGID